MSEIEHLLAVMLRAEGALSRPCPNQQFCHGLVNARHQRHSVTRNARSILATAEIVGNSGAFQGKSMGDYDRKSLLYKGFSNRSPGCRGLDSCFCSLGVYALLLHSSPATSRPFTGVAAGGGLRPGIYAGSAEAK